MSENAVFAQQVQDAGLIWVGPNPYAITVMGSKTESRQKMEQAGVPTVPGVSTAFPLQKTRFVIAEEIGYPIMLKAAAGGGGKGMREVTCAEDLPEAFAELIQRQSTHLETVISIWKNVWSNHATLKCK